MLSGADVCACHLYIIYLLHPMSIHFIDFLDDAVQPQVVLSQTCVQRKASFQGMHCMLKAIITYL